jgi:hypothetical protein
MTARESLLLDCACICFMVLLHYMLRGPNSHGLWIRSYASAEWLVLAVTLPQSFRRTSRASRACCRCVVGESCNTTSRDVRLRPSRCVNPCYDTKASDKKAENVSCSATSSAERRTSTPTVPRAVLSASTPCHGDRIVRCARLVPVTRQLARRQPPAGTICQRVGARTAWTVGPRLIPNRASGKHREEFSDFNTLTVK